MLILPSLGRIEIMWFSTATGESVETIVAIARILSDGLDVLRTAMKGPATQVPLYRIQGNPVETPPQAGAFAAVK